MASQISSISQALAGNPSIFGITQPAAVIGAHAEQTRDPASEAVAIKEGARGIGLPTPPNSISPNLQPEAFTAKLAKELIMSPAFSTIDSDIDLQDDGNGAASAGPHGRYASSKSLHKDDSSTNEGVGIITPAYLAKYHLAGMILERGPIAIRHVIDHLSRNVPGFAEIPPAKARRIVVAALESRSGGGLNGEVEFEKVGWGRWDAKVKGQPSRSHRLHAQLERPPSPPMSAISSSAPTRALRIPGHNGPRAKSRRLSHSSYTAESTFSFRSERGAFVDADVAENEAASMSIDEGEEQHLPRRTFQARLPYRIPYPRPAESAFHSDTDEEDWSNIDPVAFFFADDGGDNNMLSSSSNRRTGGGHPRSFNSQGWSIPPQNRLKAHERKPPRQLDFTGVDMDSQEKSAIEALLQMGSM